MSGQILIWQTSIGDLYEEQGVQLKEAQELQVESDAYVTELRGRVTKLTERNGSSEVSLLVQRQLLTSQVYIQDLEGRLKCHTDQQDSHSSTVAELRKEIGKFKELNTQLTEHTTEVETRFSKSETHSLQLLGQIERYEKAAEGREKAYRDLEKHIAVLDTTRDNKMLLEEVEIKDRHIADLETELGTISVAASNERAKLNGALEAEKALQESLRGELTKSQSDTSSPFKDLSYVSDTNSKEILPPAAPGLASHRDITPPDTPQAATPSAVDSDETSRLRRALEQLAAKFNEAENRALSAEVKVSDLTSQLSEVRLIRDEMDDVMPHSPVPLSAREVDEDMDDSGNHLQTPLRLIHSPTPSPARPSPIRRSSVPTLSAVAGASSSLRRDFRSSRGLTDIRRSRWVSSHYLHPLWG